MSMKKHVDKIHENEENMTCNICGKKFAKPSSLNNHVQVVHSEGDHSADCPICFKSFSIALSMRRHVRYNPLILLTKGKITFVVKKPEFLKLFFGGPHLATFFLLQ